jgi:hypothetical protein
MGIHIRIIADYSRETVNSLRAWNDVFQVLKKTLPK